MTLGWLYHPAGSEAVYSHSTLKILIVQGMRHLKSLLCSCLITRTCLRPYERSTFSHFHFHIMYVHTISPRRRGSEKSLILFQFHMSPDFGLYVCTCMCVCVCAYRILLVLYCKLVMQVISFGGSHYFKYRERGERPNPHMHM